MESPDSDKEKLKGVCVCIHILCFYRLVYGHGQCLTFCLLIIWCVGLFRNYFIISTSTVNW